MAAKNAGLAPSSQLLQLALSYIVGPRKGRDGVVRLGYLLREMHGLEHVPMPGVSASRKARPEIDAEWERACDSGLYLLEPETISAWLPTPLHDCVAEALTTGPAEFVTLAERAMKWAIRGETIDDEPRSHGKLSSGSIDTRITGAQRLIGQLDALRRHVVSGSIKLGKSDRVMIECWRKDDCPKFRSAAELGAVPAELDRSAPELRAVRLYLRKVARLLAHKRALRGARRLEGVLIPARDRIIVTLACLGLRRETILNILRGDYLPDYEFKPGVRGPALQLRRLKGLGNLSRVMALPPLLDDWINEYLAIIAELGCVLSDAQGLFVPEPRARWQGHTLLCENTIADRVAKSLRPYMQERRYSPHTCRHLAEQLAFLAGFDWMEQRRRDGDSLLEESAGLPSNPQTLADVQLDHSLSSIGDRYKDIAREPGRRWWRRVTVAGMWDYIWGDKGAPRGLDAERNLAAQVEMMRLLGLQAQAEARVAELEQQRERIEERIDREIDRAMRDANKLSSEEQFRIQMELFSLNRQTIRQSRQIEEDLRAETARALQLKDAREELARARAEKIPIADEDEPILDARQLPGYVDLDGALELERQADPLEAPVVRDEIELAEFHEAIGGEPVISKRQLRRYVEQKSAWHMLFDLNGDGTLRGIRRPTERRCFINVTQLPLDRYAPSAIERLELARRRATPRVLARRH